MDSKHRQSLVVENVYPNTGETGINQEEQEEDPREVCFTGGQVVPVAVPAVQIVHGGANVHRDFDSGAAVVEEEHVLVGVGDIADGVEAMGGGVGEFVEGDDFLDVVGTERASDPAADDFFADLEPGLRGAEEEPDLGEVGLRVSGGEGDLGEIELEAAVVGEPEVV